MTDRELLELAAKAAKYPVRGIAAKSVAYLPDDAPHLVIGNEQGGDSVWNPLVNDGDALRLAVKLGLSIEQWPDEDGDGPYAAVGHLTRPHAESGDAIVATRRVIVEAAAEIGRAA